MVDNGSRDGSTEYVKAHFPRVRVISVPQNLGFARGNNLGAEQARGEYLAFLNNDTRVHPDWLIELVRAVSEKEDAVCAGSRILSWDGKKIDFIGGAMNFHGMGFQIDYGKEYQGGHEEDKESLFACGASMLIRRDVFLDCGGFDGHFFAYYEDVDLGWRLWVLGHKVVFAGKSVAYHRHHGSTRHLPEARRLLLRERNALYSIIKNYEPETLDRVLPVALLLLIKRVYLRSGVDPSSYRLEPQPVAPAPEESSSPYTMGYYYREAWRTVREAGLGSLWGRIAAEMRRRSPALILPVRYTMRRLLAGQETVPKSALSPIIAVSDLIKHYPTLWKEREKIQASRKRSDKEISRLFARPFQVGYFDRRYEQDQGRLVQTFGLDQLWETDS
jgi:GT2 family glycosyltransferase